MFSGGQTVTFGNFISDIGTVSKVVLIGLAAQSAISFEPKVRNNQLCYEVDLKKFKNPKNMEEQLKSGLVLILDCNEERQSEHYDPTRAGGKENKFRSEKKNEIHIHLDTISN